MSDMLRIPYDVLVQATDALAQARGLLVSVEMVRANLTAGPFDESVPCLPITAAIGEAEKALERAVLDERETLLGGCEELLRQATEGAE